MGADEVTAFLTHLARERSVAASTQNQALAALLFLYGEVLARKLPWMDGIVRAKRPVRVPVVLTQQEVRAVLSQLEGTKWLMASLLYGAGLRLRKCLKLRVKDVDFSYRQIVVRDGKGAKDRITMLPTALVEPLRNHLARVKRRHECDLAEGYGEVELPFAIERKYPRAPKDWGVARRVPVDKALGRSALGRDSPTSRIRLRATPGAQRRGTSGGHRQTRGESYAIPM
jgi:integrase